MFPHSSEYRDRVAPPPSASGGNALDPASQKLAEWIASARNGSDEAFGALAARCYRYLLLVANKELGGALQAKVGGSDLVQETFLAARQGIAAFTGQTESEFKHWLRAILLNRVAHAGRYYRAVASRSIHREAPLDAADAQGKHAWQQPANITPPSRRVQAVEQSALLVKALDRMPLDYQTVVRLRSLEGLPFEAVGAQLGRSAEAARKLWVRALSVLKAELRELDESR